MLTHLSTVGADDGKGLPPLILIDHPTAEPSAGSPVDHLTADTAPCSPSLQLLPFRVETSAGGIPSTESIVIEWFHHRGRSDLLAGFLDREMRDRTIASQTLQGILDTTSMPELQVRDGITLGIASEALEPPSPRLVMDVHRGSILIVKWAAADQSGAETLQLDALAFQHDTERNALLGETDLLLDV
jgi:hypothetical protein